MPVIKDTVRNIRKSLVLDFILLIQFASCFFASTYLISYYFNIEKKQVIYQEQMGKTLDWVWPEDDVLQGGLDVLAEAKKCIQDLRNSDQFEYMVASTAGGIYMDAEGWKKHMGDLEIGAFAEGGTNTGFFMDEESGRSWTQSLKSMTVDWNGYQHLNRSLKTGRELEKGDFVRNSRDAVVPIMLGADYAGYFSPGDRIKLMWSAEEVTDCEVVGILEESSNANFSIQTYLDSYIVYPSQDREYNMADGKPIDNEIWHYSKCLRAWIVTEPDMPRNRLTQELNDIMNKYPLLGKLEGQPQTFGTKAFEGELKETVDLIARLVGIWLVFLIFTVLMVLLHKIDVREREYAILLMNGIPYGDVVKSYLLELGIFLFGAVIVTCIWQPVLRENIGEINFTVYYIAMMIVAVAVILAVAWLVLHIRFKRMDLEMLMRRKE